MFDHDDLPSADLRQVLRDHGGMTRYEAEVYLTLVKDGKTLISDLPDRCDVPSGRVYDVVENLRSEGFVEVIDSHPKKAYAVDPAEALGTVQKQIERTQNQLEDLYRSVEDIEGDVSVFKSIPTIRKYIGEIITSAEDSLILLCPHSALNIVRDELRARDTSVNTKLIISNLDAKSAEATSFEIDEDVSQLANEVRGITSNEAFAVSADMKRGFYWTGAANQRANENTQGYYITNPDLTLILDRFLFESLWPFGRPVNTDSEWSRPDFPREYIRIRNCLRDLKLMARDRSLDVFEIEVEGYETATGNEVTIRGTLAGYYFTEYDIRTYLKLDVHDASNGDIGAIVTIGDGKTDHEDYEAKRLRVDLNPKYTTDELDPETETHLRALRENFSITSTGENIVVGIDAYVDHMREIVTKQEGNESYEPLTQFSSFKDRIIEFEASDSAPAFEWNHLETEAGGHTSHFTSVFKQFDYSITAIGNFGQPVHPVFEEMFDEHTMVSLADPMYTEYVMFDDGKLLLSDSREDQIGWETLVEQIGVDNLVEYIDETELLSLGTWEVIPSFPSIWRGLREEVWPRLESPPRFLQIVLSDVGTLSDEKLEAGIAELQTFGDVVPITVTMNREHARKLLQRVERDFTDHGLQTVAQTLYEYLEVTKCIIHTNREAVLVSEAGVTYAQGPITEESKRPINADAHFEAGVVLGELNEMDDGSMLLLGHAVADFFLQNDRSPTVSELETVVERYDSNIDVSLTPDQ